MLSVRSRLIPSLHRHIGDSPISDPTARVSGTSDADDRSLRSISGSSSFSTDILRRTSPSHCFSRKATTAPPGTDPLKCRLLSHTAGSDSAGSAAHRPKTEDSRTAIAARGSAIPFFFVSVLFLFFVLSFFVSFFLFCCLLPFQCIVFTDHEKSPSRSYGVLPKSFCA